MPYYPPEEIYAAARTLLPDLEETLRRKVEDLLAQAEGGADTYLQLLDLLTQDDETRTALRSLLKKDEAERTLGEYSGLGGEHTSTPGKVYVCPQCDYRYVIGEAGEEPLCPQHGVKLIPDNAEEV